MGGDGTILRGITYIGDSNIPILGINTGRLGFLATVQKSEINKAFSALLKGEFNCVNRTLLSVQSNPEIEELKEKNFALNEISVARLNTASMIGIETHLNNIYLTNYWADGLIVSTPTGSTGYSLSCGGPVIDRKSNSLVLTPIAPHNLNARPLVISNSTEITMKVEGRQEEFLLSLDSRILNLKAGTTLTISKANFAIRIIELQDQTFYETLRSKLLWGEDTRNRK
jgi:NAD+ kinase